MIFFHHWHSACVISLLVLSKGRPAEEAIDQEHAVISEELPEERQMMKDVEPCHRRPE
jgi:hypothetical protein